MKLIDVNADRCIYQDVQNRRYIITPDKGHEYTETPFKVVFDDQTTLEFGGSISTYENDQITSTLITGSFGERGIAVNSINFGIRIPNTSEQLNYEWEAGYDAQFYIWPER